MSCMGHLPGCVFKTASQVNPHLPAGVDEVLRKGLARHAHERYKTVAEFQRDLHKTLGS